ncbi:bifunctional 2',3'-cyclic-nucleotide 2'-phosphodiesterase/3'-nucleotidase [Streptococcus pseudoporcinus]|uniref:Bifunctional 2',3'-cyclic nucleotide 2'-phosphodiesterase/3'-nucleotidase protein n=1 Tax=Streptococcus pseudoporcinus LQ 940-04 TaxID=875093 RepID=G5KA85_9STRE|nr:bifunctional 2',3'-cyclic-nucleotide 2'-phosphodiesterase/3'-nucleotidase [Streptococcus pseudoporcinus]EFR43529.1 bifunctional 2',3'-cyclic nucleotide 2'-phosphodiesterase/3'-nucleotidase protein [Streptococcus pseudoporcinus SPIN 20026]EHI64846.1 bifunctional 2',3'-cyclic nucleotide 2'-phosphodiesterase/3'-nucleotidase protein [Streptococcus pseudoporcinus LQ 940-04]VEF93609.1 bifunctional 2',3'-cyclic nucleotide 2'-phosphodiesterase/3'-nucleotidase protein [Streptococcus pseudoporcinus]
MRKYYVSKSALLLAMLLFTGATQIVKAESSNAATTPMSSNTNVPSDDALITATTSSRPTAPTTTDLPTVTNNTNNQEIPSAPANPDPKTNSQLAPVARQQASAPVEGQNIDVRIVSTTDLHSNLVNYDYYQDKDSQTIGLAKTAILIDQARTENPNTILVDNGDILQGTPLGTYTALIKPVSAGEVHPMYAALNALGYDASTLGNHEFNYGLPFLKQVIASAGLPIVNANVLDVNTDQFVFKPYDIITKTFTDANGQAVNLKVGITGIVPPQIMAWDKANLEGKVRVKDAVQAVTEIIPTIKKAGADIILVLAHTGIGDTIYEVGEENVGYQIASLAGVDAVVTGHSHAEFPSGTGTGTYETYAGVDGVSGLINGTPVTMAGKYGDHIGVIDLDLTYTGGKWLVNKEQNHAEIRKINTKSTEADPNILAIAAKAHQGTIDYVRQTVGETKAPITSYFALVKDDPSVQIVNKAQLWYAKQQLAGTPEANLPLLSAAAPFKAGTRNDPTAYTDIPAGPIAIKNVADLYLYDNVTAIVKVTGADLKEWLEMAAGQFNTIDPTNTGPQNLVNTDFRTYNFDVIDGVTYEFDITQANKYDAKGDLVNPYSSRVRNLKYQGKDIDPNQEFMVVTNNYRSSGTFPGVKNATFNRLLNLENRQAIINYIVSEKTINPSADNNWYFANTIEGLNLHFLTADEAKNRLKDIKDISYHAPSAIEGFGDFIFTYIKPEKSTNPVGRTDTTNPNNPRQTDHHLTDSQRQYIYQLAAKLYHQTNRTQANTSETIANKQLPHTGVKESLNSLILGLSFLGFAGLFKKKGAKKG